MRDFAAERRDSLVRYLRKHVAGEVRFDDTSRHLYSTDASHYQIRPLGVVIPKSQDDLKSAVQIAADLGVPITARGSGTSLSGQSIGPGMVIDCSKYLNRIGDVDVSGRKVRVQPGIVLDHLNRELARFGLAFGPDVATASRATLGGMMGNNSAGARSIVYGQTVDHVRSLDMILSDGTRATFFPLTPTEYEQKLELRTREGEAYRAADAAVRQNGNEIVARTPKIMRKVSGYNLAGLIPGVRSQVSGVGNTRHNGQPSPIAEPRRLNPNLVPLLIGSEGTLAVIAEAELALVPRPKYRGLLVPQFESLGNALDALAVCLELGPSAVELMDKMLIDLARVQRSLKDTMAAVRGRPEALLMVEFSSDDASDVSYRVHELERRLGSAVGLITSVPAIDAAIRDPLWDLRRAAMPLLYGLPGDRKPVTFVEDCAVAPERLPEFTALFREIFRRHGTDGAFYGHASVGCLHVRPVLNLHDPSDAVLMRRIMEEVTDLVLRFNGTLSGEHGDGLVRSEWNRKMFGPVVYEAFQQVKRGFDPENVLNPGKIVDSPAMEEHWRLPPGPIPPDPPTILDFSKQGGFFKSAEACNGAGVCRKTQGGAMCPSYRATKDERDTTRGRANALRIALSVQDSEDGSEESVMDGRLRSGLTPDSRLPTPLSQRWIAEVMDLCLSCKACKSECPANVDVAKLKAEFLQAFYEHRPRPLGHLLVKNIHRLSPLAARFAGMNNWLARRPFLRRAMQSITGIDRRRSLPEWHRDHFRRWFSRRTPVASPPVSASHPCTGVRGSPRVVLLDDCFTTFQEPGIGQAAVTLLERVGYEVELASICCGRAMISKGFLTDARRLAQEGIARLDSYAAAGIPILGLEPSCILTLADEWPELVPGSAAKRVAAAAEMADSWLGRQVRENGVSLELAPRNGKVLFHAHCHQKALVGPKGSAEALRMVPGTDLTVLDVGCCGMAGSFGYETEHYDLSVAIANLALIPAVTAEPEATIVATGTSCRHQIRDLTGRVALHPLEVLAGNQLSLMNGH
ncbi:MAG TPA: FAD-linked oxidase C-terminal domain-containing protein [Gemmata sp.]|nr:FAD-linked oxidase C-terminal domain-containing protein [Gemmata sp.]